MERSNVLYFGMLSYKVVLTKKRDTRDKYHFTEFIFQLVRLANIIGFLMERSDVLYFGMLSYKVVSLQLFMEKA